MTGNEVIEEAIRILLGGSREEMNRLAADAAFSDTLLSFEFPLGGIREGSQLGVGNEMYRVWSVDDTAKTAVVQPGVLGSTTDSHTQGTLVYVNPRFPRFAVLKAMNDEIRSLSSPSHGLYRMAETEFVYNPSVSDYELPEDVMDVYDVYADSPGTSQAWLRVPHWSWNASADPLSFVNGKSIRVPTGWQGRTIRVIYKAAFAPVVDEFVELSAGSYMPEEMQDILSLGVLMRLGPSREIKRNFTETQRSDASRAEEVPSGAVTNSFSWVRNQRETRITEERTRLERLYPPRHPAR